MTGHTFAVQHIRPMCGCAQAQLLRCADGGYYVVKFQNNLQGIRTLANDLLGTLLAEQLGLPISQPAVIDVSEKLIEHSEGMMIGPRTKRVPCLSGLSFGSRYPVDADFPAGNVLALVHDIMPETLIQYLENIGDYAGMLVFDKWTCNTDNRQTVFHRRRSKGPYHATMIDQGLCFNGTSWNFPDAPLRGLYSPPSVYEEYRGFDAFEPWLGRLENDMNEGILQRACGEIPTEWYEQNVGALARLIEDLDRRRNRVRELLWTLLKASPVSFPKWCERPDDKNQRDANLIQLSSKPQKQARLPRSDPRPKRDVAIG